MDAPLLIKTSSLLKEVPPPDLEEELCEIHVIAHLTIVIEYTPSYFFLSQPNEIFRASSKAQLRKLFLYGCSLIYGKNPVARANLSLLGAIKLSSHFLCFSFCEAKTSMHTSNQSQEEPLKASQFAKLWIRQQHSNFYEWAAETLEQYRRQHLRNLSENSDCECLYQKGINQ